MANEINGKPWDRKYVPPWENNGGKQVVLGGNNSVELINNANNNAYSAVDTANEAIEYSRGVNIVDYTSMFINHTLARNTDIVFASPYISSINIIIPNTIKSGFFSGLDFKSGASPPTIKITNNTIYKLIISLEGLNITTSGYIPASNKYVQTVFMFSGEIITMDIRELVL